MDPDEGREPFFLLAAKEFLIISLSIQKEKIERQKNLKTDIVSAIK